MHRIVKPKRLFYRGRLRKSALTASAASRRGFPAWIDSSECAVAFPAVTVTPRVRDGLVLRKVAKRKSASKKGSGIVHGAR